MRGAQILLPIALALAIAACARQQPASTAFDAATGQDGPVVKKSSEPSYGPASVRWSDQQIAETQSAAAVDQRSLYNSPQTAQQSYAQAIEQRQYTTSEQRGLLNSLQHAPDFSAQPATMQNSAYLYHPPSAAAAGAAQHRPSSASAAAYAAQPLGDAAVPTHKEQSYTLGPGDKLRVIVFGQNGISGSYLVDASGNVSLPLAGTVPAHGETTAQLARRIADRLKQGYVREPHVTVSVESYRPFFILGEVTNPGQYPYVPNMTAETAVAIAGGFTPRAKKKEVELTRNADGQRFDGDVPFNYPLRPGDTVVVKERWF